MTSGNLLLSLLRQQMEEVLVKKSPDSGSVSRNFITVSIMNFQMLLNHLLGFFDLKVIIALKQQCVNQLICFFNLRINKCQL